MGRSASFTGPIVVPHPGGDGDLRRFADAIATIQRQLEGKVRLTPRDALLEAAGRDRGGGNSALAGVPIVLGAGTWSVYSALTFPHTDLVLRGMGPQTIIRREFSGDGDAMLTFSGTNVTLEWLRLECGQASTATTAGLVAMSGTKGRVLNCEFDRAGISTRAQLVLAGARGESIGCRFKDTSTSGSHTGQAVKVTADDCIVERGYFESCYEAIRTDGANRATLRGNYVEAARAVGDGLIFLTGTSAYNYVGQNICRVDVTGAGPATDFIYAGDSVSRTAFVGNIAIEGASGVRACVSYLAAGNNEEAANITSVTAR